MNYRKQHMITAITLMAVICFGLMVSGCATKRDIKDINDRLARIEENAHASRTAVARMDSVITANTEASQKLQNDVRYSSEELATQINQLLQNYNDLMARIDQLTSKPNVIKVSPTSSPGAQPDTAVQTTPPPPAAVPSTECIDAYDSAFTLVRRGEYDNAIAGFQAEKYIENTYGRNR